MNILEVIYVPSAFLLKHHLPLQETLKALPRIPLEELLEQRQTVLWFCAVKQYGRGLVNLTK